MKYKQKISLTSIAAIAAIFLSACAGNNADSKDSLIIYSGRSESLIGPLIAQFESETGIDAKVRYGGTSELAATLLEEGRASPADIFFAQDPGGLGAVANSGMLSELPEEILNRVDSQFVDPQKMWVGISGRIRVAVFNTNNVTQSEMPSDIFGFIDPKWKNRIGLPPTNASFQSMVTSMRIFWGEEKTTEWLTGIMANEPIFYEKNTPTVAAVAAGEVDVGFVNHYYLYRFIAEEGDDFPAQNYYFPEPGPSSLVLVAGVSVLKSASNVDNAHQFINFLLDNSAQEYFANQTYEYPLVDGVEINSLLPSLNTLSLSEISISDLEELQATVILLQDVGMLP